MDLCIESMLPVCDKPYHMNNGFQQTWAEIENLWNYALFSFKRTLIKYFDMKKGKYFEE